jgi:Protein of unknown function (DUF2846)
MNYFLKSHRLGFRLWAEDDPPLAMQLWGDPEVTKMIGGPSNRTTMPCGLEAGIDISLRMGCIKPCSICLQGITGGLMYKLALGVVILAAMAWAQENSAVCGPDQTKFEAKREAHSHPTGSAEPGKALVYVFGDSELDNATIHIGGLITRVGVDGQWAGAYQYKSYMYFSVDPGAHRLCTSQQSALKSRRDSTASAITFTAEEGKVYYFRTQPSPRAVARSAVTGVPTGDVELAALDPAQAQLMIPKWAYSTSQLRK